MFKAFIPEIYAPGLKYDWRMDLIDACIYYLELKRNSKYRGIVLRMWQERTNVALSKEFNPNDLEWGTYGYISYHPMLHMGALTLNSTYIIPRIVEYIIAFQEMRRQLDIDDHAFIFFNVLSSYMLEITINARVHDLLRKFNEFIQKRPLVEKVGAKKLERKKEFPKTFEEKYPVIILIIILIIISIVYF